nr:hypothetical protein [Tanacetum cinerariifolium]
MLTLASGALLLTTLNGWPVTCLTLAFQIVSIFCHQCTCELCGNGAHYGYNCPSKVPIIPNLEPFNNQTIKELPQTLPSFDPTCYSEDGNSFTYDSTSNLVHDSPNIFDPPPQLPFYSCEFCRKYARYGHYCTPQIPACYDDDDDDYTIEITHKKPDNSLSMGDEHLDLIPAMESDEFIKSSVENLVPNPSESEGEYEVDVPAYEDFPKKIYSNPLFDEGIISMKIDPHPLNAESDLIESLPNHDSSIISSSSKIDSLFDEFAGKLTLLKSIPPRINETDCELKNLKTSAGGFCPPSLHFLSFIRESYNPPPPSPAAPVDLPHHHHLLPASTTTSHETVDHRVGLRGNIKNSKPTSLSGTKGAKHLEVREEADLNRGMGGSRSPPK